MDRNSIDDKSVFVEWEPVRHNRVIDLVVVDVTALDEEERKTVIQGMGVWHSKFNKKYDKLILRVDSQVSDKFRKEIEPKDLVILQGVRKETEEEFRDRIGINEDESWTVQYQKMMGCTKSEAKAEMVKMLQTGSAYTPEGWRQYKHEQVEEFLNIKSKTK